MAKYLLDTNIVLRFSNPSDTQHDLAKAAVATLLMQGNECYLASQVLIELWVVATRPSDVNGLGWSIEQTRNIIDQLLERFPLIEETFQVFPTWLNVVIPSLFINATAITALLSFFRSLAVIPFWKSLVTIARGLSSSKLSDEGQLSEGDHRTANRA